MIKYQTIGTNHYDPNTQLLRKPLINLCASNIGFYQQNSRVMPPKLNHEVFLRRTPMEIVGRSRSKTTTTSLFGTMIPHAQKQNLAYVAL